MKESVSHLQYLIAPWTAPLPSAATVAVVLYNSLSGLMHPVLAFIFAGAGMIGMESSGGLMFTLGARALVHRRWEVMAAAITGALIYVGIVVWTIYTSNEARAIVGSVLVTIVTYLGVGLYEYIRESDAERKAAVEAEIKAADSAADTALKLAEANRISSEARARELDAERQLTNAQTKQIKASTVSSGQPSVSGGQGRTAGQARFDPAVLEKVIALLSASPDPETVSVRKIEEAGVGVKKTQASGYKSEALRIIKERKAAL